MTWLPWIFLPVAFGAGWTLRGLAVGHRQPSDVLERLDKEDIIRRAQL